MPEALLEATPLESACSTDLLSRRAESGTRPELSVPAWFSGLWAVLRSNRAIAGRLGAAAILARPIGTEKSDSNWRGVNTDPLPSRKLRLAKRAVLASATDFATSVGDEATRFAPAAAGAVRLCAPASMARLSTELRGRPQH